jgi:DNA-directed RNA polymerase beta' subunit
MYDFIKSYSKVLTFRACSYRILIMKENVIAATKPVWHINNFRSTVPLGYLRMLKHKCESVIYSFPDYRMLISSNGYGEHPQRVANQSDFVSYFVARNVRK